VLRKLVCVDFEGSSKPAAGGCVGEHMIEPLGALRIRLWGSEAEDWFRFPHDNEVVSGGGGKGGLSGASDGEKGSCTNVGQDTDRRP
jgi:hypothetical protein